MSGSTEEDQDMNVRILLSRCQARQKQLAKKHPAVGKAFNLNALDGCMGGNFFLTEQDWSELATLLDGIWLDAVFALNEYAKEHHRLFLDLDLYLAEPVQADHMANLYRQLHHIIIQVVPQLQADPRLACCHVLQPNSLRRIPCPSHLLERMRALEPSLMQVEDKKISVYKFGTHIVFPNLIVNQEQAVKIRDLIVNCLELDPGTFLVPALVNTWDTVVDRDVYEKGSLRLPGARKTEKRYFQLHSQKGCFKSWVKSSYRYYLSIVGGDSVPLTVQPHPPYREMLINVYHPPAKPDDDIAYQWVPRLSGEVCYPTSVSKFVQQVVAHFSTSQWQESATAVLLGEDLDRLYPRYLGLEGGDWVPSPLNVSDLAHSMHISLEEPGKEGAGGKQRARRGKKSGTSGGNAGAGGSNSPGRGNPYTASRSNSNMTEMSPSTREFEVVTQLMRRLPLEQHRSLSVRKLMRGNTKRYYKMDVQGINERFCINKGDHHTHSRIYFYITIAGISQKCYSGKTVQRIHGYCNEFRSMPHKLTEAELNVLFPDNATLDTPKFNPAFSQKKKKAGEQGKDGHSGTSSSSSSSSSSMQAGSIYHDKRDAPNYVDPNSPAARLIQHPRVHSLSSTNQAYLRELCATAAKLDPSHSAK